MSFGERYAVSSYQKIFGDSPRLPASSSSSRLSGGSPRGSPGLRSSMATARSGAPSLSLYRRAGRSSTHFAPVPSGSLDLTQTSVVNNEFKIIRTNEKEQLQVGETGEKRQSGLNIYEREGSAMTNVYPLDDGWVVG